MNKSHRSLAERIESLEGWADFSAWMIVVGLVVEVGLAAGVSDSSFVNKWGLVASDALVAIGVAGEILFTRRARRLSTELQTKSNEQIAAANERAANAELELAKFRSRRFIPPVKMEEIAERLKRFAPVKFDFLVSAIDQEFMGLMDQIGLMCLWANWEWVDWPLNGIRREDNRAFGTGSETHNVTVEHVFSAPQMVQEAARALATELTGGGIAASDLLGSAALAFPGYEETVHIRIGRKT